MISTLRPNTFKVLSLTTVATPHHGSPVADYLLTNIPSATLTQLYDILHRMQMRTGAFKQLTTTYMTQTFNPSTPDLPDVRYFSYGASCPKPGWWSVFRYSWDVVGAMEGENDGLVSVDSAKWGEYQGTLVGVSHLDIINWYNRLGYWVGGMVGRERGFNAVVFYCDVVDGLGKKGF